MEVSGQPHVLAVFVFLGTAMLPIELEIWWAPEYVWTFWRIKETVTLVGIRIADCPARSAVSIPNSLRRLLVK